MSTVKGIIFDLDDTLYPEREYVRSGFKRIAQLADENCGLPQHEVFSLLWRLFESGVRGETFNRLLQNYPLLAAKFAIADLVSLYRSHRPEIELPSEIFQLLVRLRKAGLFIGVVSDGPLESQIAKVKALGLYELVDKVILTDQWGPEFWKPHPRSYVSFMEDWKLPPYKLVYIGDNPLKDFVTPKHLGWHTIHLRMQNQLRCDLESASVEHSAEFTVNSIADLVSTLKA